MENKPTMSKSFNKPIYKSDDRKLDESKFEEATNFTSDIFVDDEEIKNDDTK